MPGENGEAAIASLKRRLLSGGAWALGGRILLALTGLALSTLLGRLLSPKDLGTFFLVFSVVSLCAVIGSLGLATVAVRFVAEGMGVNKAEQVRGVIIRILVLGTSATVVVSIAYLTFGDALVADLFTAQALASVAGLTAVWILAMSLQQILSETFRGFHDIKLATIFGRSTAGFGSLAAGVLMTVGLAAIWLLGGRADLASVMWLAVGSGLVCALVAGWLLYRKVRDLSNTKSGSTVKSVGLLIVTWPVLVTDLTLFALTQADLWIVGAFQSQSEVALYGAAVRLVTFVLMPLLIVNAVVPPIVAEQYAQGRTHELEKVLRTTATLAGAPAFLVLVCFTFLGGPILSVMFGDYYRGGAIILAILCLGQLVTVWSGSCGITMTMTGHQTMLMAITVFSGGATVAVGLLLVGDYGTTGVAIAAATSIALQNIATWLGVRFATGMWTHVAFGDVPKMIMALRRR